MPGNSRCGSSGRWTTTRFGATPLDLGFGHCFAADFAGPVAVFALDEHAWVEDGLDVRVIGPTLEIAGVAASVPAIHLFGTIGYRFTVEVSDNLAEWAPLDSVTLGTAAFQLQDTSAGGATFRFYRVRGAR